MIGNARQYALTKKSLEGLKESLGELKGLDLAKLGIDPEITEAHRRSLRLQIEDLTEQLTTYENLSRGDIKALDVSSIEDIGPRLVAARIANGWTQREFADRLGMKEQQVQRYEKDRYASASFARLVEISKALGVHLRGNLERDEFAGVRTTTDVRDFISNIDPKYFPLAEMAKKGWVDSAYRHIRDGQQRFRLMIQYFENTGTRTVAPMLNKRTATPMSDRTKCALLAWQARVNERGRSRCRNLPSFSGLEPTFLRDLVHLSVEPEGPKKAISMLREAGVCVVFVSHLQGSLLDGAATLLPSGNPLIGMTLRNDRLDNFWFVLFHELGHVAKHRYSGLAEGFIDVDVDDVEDKREQEANDFAQNALIPEEVWNRSFVRFTSDVSEVKRFADTLGINPAIVAGRIRLERKDYSLFSSLVGRGKLKEVFGEELC